MLWGEALYVGKNTEDLDGSGKRKEWGKRKEEEGCKGWGLNNIYKYFYW